jgi:hypothetical protein
MSSMAVSGASPLLVTLYNSELAIDDLLRRCDDDCGGDDGCGLLLTWIGQLWF